MENGYRIVEIKGGKVMSLFHGTRRRREIPIGIWHRCDKKIVRDGSGESWYESGWHYLRTYAEAEEFFEKMFRVRENRYIISCKVRGNIREKWSGNCWLADEILIDEHNVEEALDGREWV
jgi:hypothetical protein